MCPLISYPLLQNFDLSNITAKPITLSKANVFIWSLPDQQWHEISQPTLTCRQWQYMFFYDCIDKIVERDRKQGREKGNNMQ